MFLTNRRIDGLTHWNKKGEVFKVVTMLDIIFGIIISDNGLAFSTPMWPLDKDINSVLGGGWLKSPPDSGWNLIFEKAR